MKQAEFSNKYPKAQVFSLNKIGSAVKKRYYVILGNKLSEPGTYGGEINEAIIVGSEVNSKEVLEYSRTINVVIKNFFESMLKESIVSSNTFPRIQNDLNLPFVRMGPDNIVFFKNLNTTKSFQVTYNNESIYGNNYKFELINNLGDFLDSGIDILFNATLKRYAIPSDAYFFRLPHNNTLNIESQISLGDFDEIRLTDNVDSNKLLTGNIKSFLGALEGFLFGWKNEDSNYVKNGYLSLEKIEYGLSIISLLQFKLNAQNKKMLTKINCDEKNYQLDIIGNIFSDTVRKRSVITQLLSTYGIFKIELMNKIMDILSLGSIEIIKEFNKENMDWYNTSVGDVKKLFQKPHLQKIHSLRCTKLKELFKNYEIEEEYLKTVLNHLNDIGLLV